MEIGKLKVESGCFCRDEACLVPTKLLVSTVLLLPAEILIV
ncbi:MAG: hypothetical protein ABIE14_00145 [Patescibacteria group bacterium]